ncbi:DUF4145 domain-containing protein [Aeromicrobium phragmitis]|uniref:DUF4145 domain-containing protein n=1 Tax=Aeromicrobium phragmitis TaxID=2478914 RepID=UPI00140AA169|nr:DUF4145 domain-containing protein [Aeromicrobium phragmitis]
MSQVTSAVATIENTSRFSEGDSYAWADYTCPHCHAKRMVRIAHSFHTSASNVGRTQWLRCPACAKGAVVQDGKLYPERKPLRQPQGLPDADARIWDEVRTCLGAGANTASVMLCRKLLFHVAVEHGLPAKNEKNRAPTFKEAVDHLRSEGIVTTHMLEWVDRIKDVGNDANHEVTPIDAKVAEDVATFTEQLLVLAYEMKARMKNASPQTA